jgi:hypothetical protein
MKKFLLSLLEPLDRILWNWMCVNGFILFQKGRDRTKSPNVGPNNISTGVKNFSSRSNPQSNVKDKSGEIAGKLGGTTDPPRAPTYQEESNTVLYYPSTLPSNPNRPQVKFSCIDRKPEQNNKVFTDRSEIYFPCPGNITFADQANYNVLDLGIIGIGLSQDRGESDLGGAFKSIAQSIGKNAGAGKLVEISNFRNKEVVNPFQNTAFSGNQIRNFTFNFKMIAKNATDAAAINLIHRKFRAKSYAQKSQGSAAFLKYPPIWEIDFIQGYTNTGFTKNPFLPEINLCYLTSVNTTFNTTAAAWAPSGSPIEVDVSLTFQETRANERDDILNMESLQDIEQARQYDRTSGKQTNYYGATDNTLTN